MNKSRYQTFLLTRILQGNGYGSIDALLQAIAHACAIPESEFRERKSAFNAIGDKAPIRNTSDLAIAHSDIPQYLEREWSEFNAFSTMTKNVTRPADMEEVLQRYWMTDADMAHSSSAPAASSQELAEQIKQVIRDDGFDVARADDGRWYGADEQDREAGREGEHDTEHEAWADLVLARFHVLEEAGLDPTGVFEPESSPGPDPAGEGDPDAPR